MALPSLCWYEPGCLLACLSFLLNIIGVRSARFGMDEIGLYLTTALKMIFLMCCVLTPFFYLFQVAGLAGCGGIDQSVRRILHHSFASGSRAHWRFAKVSNSLGWRQLEYNREILDGGSGGKWSALITQIGTYYTIYCINYFILWLTWTKLCI